MKNEADKRMDDLWRLEGNPRPPASWVERWWTPERSAEYDRLFNPPTVDTTPALEAVWTDEGAWGGVRLVSAPSVYDWIDPWDGR